MAIAGKSHIGLVRAQNEDAYAMDEEHGVFLVADGIGGHEHGEVASQLAVESFLASYRTETDAPMLERIRRAFKAANHRVHAFQEEKAAGHLMGTTLTVATLDAQNLYVGHVGDSRAYISRFQDDIRQITEDHTFFAELAKQDPTTQERLLSDSFRLQHDYLARAIGPEEEVQPQVLKVALQVGDRVLLVTDGVYKNFTPEDLLSLLHSSDDPKLIVDELERRSLEAGGRDNLTSVLYIHEGR